MSERALELLERASGILLLLRSEMTDKRGRAAADDGGVGAVELRLDVKGLRELPPEKRLEVMRGFGVELLEAQRTLVVERHRALSTVFLRRHQKLFLFNGDGWVGDELRARALWLPKGSSKGVREMVITQVLHLATQKAMIVGNEPGQSRPRTLAFGDLQPWTDEERRLVEEAGAFA